MVLKEKQKKGRRIGGPAEMRVYRRKYRRRRRRAFLVVSALAVLVQALILAGVATSGPGGSPSAEGGTQVDRIDAPRVEAVPEAAQIPASEQAGPAETDPDANEQEARTETSGDNWGEVKPKEEQKEPEQASDPPPIPQPPTNDLWMTIPKMELYDDYVANDSSLAAMDQGAIKLPSTGFPWQEGANTYIAAHRIGYPGTESYYQFYDLVNLQLGDKIYVGDANGTTYTYEVTGFKEVLPSETYVTAPKAGRDMISLQTCIEDYGDYWTMGPNWYVRYVVQADRVAVDQA